MTGRWNRDDGGGPLRVVVADDEPPAREGIRHGLDRTPGVQVVAECADGWETVRAVRELGPDLVFLDVRMPGLDGFEVVREVGTALMPPVVFVTAYDRYALQAFEVHALDYVLKPFEDERLAEVVERAVERHTVDAVARRRRMESLLSEAGAGAGRSPWVNRFSVRVEDDRIRLLPATSIDWIEAAGNYVKLHTGEEAHRVRTTMAHLEEVLDPTQFVRIHRSSIVNIERIRELQPWFGGDYVALLRDGRQLRVSRHYRDRVVRPLA